LPEPTETRRPWSVDGETAHLPQPAASGGPADPLLPGSDVDGIAARVRRECAAQGIPEKVEEQVILAKIVTLAYEGVATPSRRP
jgi:hypothetical protein